MAFKKILVALDHSLQSPIVFERSLEQAKAEGGQLMLVHTLRLEAEMPTGPFMGIGTIADVDLYGNLRRLQQERMQQDLEKARTWLQTYCDKAIAAGVPAQLDCQVGEPSVRICEIARTWNADLIVIGRRGHQGLTEVVLGSVSNYVVHHAPCSVLVVQGIAPVLEETEAATTAVSSP
ncbi:MAG TPA: universal stress protein [Synechococcales cyanobacterium M55_K2018_004]|nr:universal stress protein [Synechococcales cyanobacterium M55_K2018_004]